MKKLYTLFLLLFISNSFYSQNKYITFSDSVSFSTSLMYGVENYRLKSIPNQEGYIGIGTANDWTNYNYYFSRFDFDGSLIFDTLLSFSPSMTAGSYSSAFGVSETAIYNWSEYAGVSGNSQPSIFKYDLDGNLAFAKYFAIDTLNSYNKNGFLSSLNNSLLFGSVYNLLPIEVSYVLKADENGTALWHKAYGFKYDLTVIDWSANVTKMAETPSGGYIFGALISNDLGDVFPSFTKIDENGTIEWNKTFEFLAPIHNSGDGGTEIVEILPMQDGNMLLALNLLDSSLGAIGIGLISIDPLSGSVNWTKFHARNLGDGAINLNGLVMKNDGSYVGYYNRDTEGSFALSIDNTGEITHIVQFNNNPADMQYYQGLTSTNDNGMMLYYSESFSYPSFVKRFKANENTEIGCPNAVYPIIPNSSTLNYNLIVALDTVVDLNAISQNISLTTPTTLDDAQTSLFCSCELIAYGNVSYTGSNIPTDSVMIFLYEITETGSYLKRDSVETDVAGYYQFNYLPEGQYVVKAIPSLIKYPNYLPTYFNNLTGATQWDSAYVLNLACGSGPIDGDINLIPKLPQTGAWQCNGYVFEFTGYSLQEKKAPGEPIPDIDITIDQSPGGSVSSVTTDTNGYFSFTGLNNNVTFVVRVDLPGYPNDSVYSFTVTPGDPALDSLNFYVSADSVFIFPEDIFTGVNIIQSKNLEVSIAPNPTKSTFVLAVTSTRNTVLNINLTNSLGQVVLSNQSNLNTGLNKINFNIQNQPSGVYFMSINYENNHFIKKIIKQ